MNSNEIKEGDVVYLKSCENNGRNEMVYMTVGKLSDDIATCFWTLNRELRKEDIPIAALYCLKK